jgi:hypothetical protein
LLSALLIPNWVSDGPMARTTTFTGLVLLLDILPVVVHGDPGPGRSEEAEDRIVDHVRHPEVGERRTKAADNDPLRVVACDDEPANHDTFARIHPETGGDINRLRSRAG